MPRTVDDLLAEARRGPARPDPRAALEAVEAGALLLDVRSETQRAADGVVPGSIHHPRNVLEWRCDPSSQWRDPRVGGFERHLIVMCDEGYGSSFAAANLRALGFEHATDLDGGFQAWKAAGLPVQPA